MIQGRGSEQAPVARVPQVAVESGRRGVAGRTPVRRWSGTTRCNELAVIVMRDGELVGRESLIAAVIRSSQPTFVRVQVALGRNRLLPKASGIHHETQVVRYRACRRSVVDRLGLLLARYRHPLSMVGFRLLTSALGKLRGFIRQRVCGGRDFVEEVSALSRRDQSHPSPRHHRSCQRRRDSACRVGGSGGYPLHRQSIRTCGESGFRRPPKRPGGPWSSCGPVFSCGWERD